MKKNVFLAFLVIIVGMFIAISSCTENKSTSGSQETTLVADNTMQKPIISEETAKCISCHGEKDRGKVIVEDWKQSRHSAVGVGCVSCHQAGEDDVDGFDHEGFHIATVVTPNDCATCHPKESKEFQHSYHADAGMIMGSLDNVLAEVVEGHVAFNDGSNPAAAAGCWQCHGSKVTLLKDKSGKVLKDENGRVAGALLYNLETKEYSVVRAKTTILTTGGFGRLHIAGFATTNHYGATGDGIVMAYRAGAKLRDLDSTQFHPTGAAFPEQIVGLLITEKVRSLGAQVLGKNGEQICYPLEPRDVEAASIIKVTKSTDNYVETPTGMRGVWLDSPLIEEIRGKGTIDKNLAAMKRMFSRFDIDMTEDPILVHPTLHYQNGGVELDEHGYTSVPGLLGAGEISGGVHGKNRLMGNSLLEVNVFGRRAGITAAKEYKRGKKPGKLTLSHVKKAIEQIDTLNLKKKRFSPVILPEYRSEAVRDRLIQLFESSL